MVKYIVKYLLTRIKGEIMNNGKLVLKKCIHCGKLIEEINSSISDTICCR